MRRVATVLTFGLVVAACTGGQAHVLSGYVRTPQLHVGTVQLRDVATSDTGTPYAMRARPAGLLLVFFGYTSCPDICPTTLADIKLAVQKLGHDAKRVEVAFVTVDPQHDTRTILRAFVGHFVADAHLLRAVDATQLANAQRAFLATSKPQTGGTFDHASAVSVVDQTGTVVVEWPFGITPTAIAADLRVLLARASK